MTSSAVTLPVIVPPTTVLPTPRPLPGLNNLTEVQPATFVQSHAEAFRAGIVAAATSTAGPAASSSTGTTVAAAAPAAGGTATSSTLASAGVGINVSRSV